MGKRHKRNFGPDATSRDLRAVHNRFRQRPDPRWWSSRASAAACALILCVLLPDISQLWPRDHYVVLSGQEMQTRWVVWLALTHVSIFGISAVGAMWSREPGVWIMLLFTGVWFLLQGVDEVVAGNFVKDGYHEYPILLGVILLVGFIIKRYGGNDQRA